MGSDNWNASGCKGLSPMITIQPTTDVILLGSVLNWKKTQRSCYSYSNYLVYETILIVKISYFFSVYRNGVKTYIQNQIGYVIVNDSRRVVRKDYLLMLCRCLVRIYKGNTVMKFPIMPPNTLSKH